MLNQKGFAFFIIIIVVTLLLAAVFGGYIYLNRPTEKAVSEPETIQAENSKYQLVKDKYNLTDEQVEILKKVNQQDKSL